MMKTKLALLGCSSCLLWLASATAQKPAAANKSPAVMAYKLIGLNVTGSEKYTEKEILPASGLALGQNVVEADFKEAARHLGNTGLFSDVSYTFSYSPAGTKVEFQLTDIDDSKLVPAHFENFVWFSDEQLLSELKKRVPLFKMRMPVSGTMPDDVEQALQAVIDEKKIPARVDYLREAPQQGGSLIGVAYRVEALEINIRNVEFPGATPDLLPGLQAATRKLAGARYMRSPLAQVASIEFMPVCLHRGYLKASFADAQARVVSQAEGEVEVDAILPLTPGKVYSTSSVEWKGNKVIPADDLQRLIHLPNGQAADAVRLVSDLETVRKLYHGKGYMAAQINPKPVMDDERSTVHYDLVVNEGDQYKMGEFEVAGLDSQARAHLQAAWKLKEGDPYDSEYPKKFLNENSRLVPGDVPWAIGIHEAVNERDKTVDVTIRFSSK
ncbi:MAG TPA: POTRA domain-containing protein [Terriglobales bacterium]|nr:POTRA domain-containing protein [Terriglobales bacterium]